jgi:hypothetical protein
MLNGNEKIKDISNNDICNYIGNNTKGAKNVEIRGENFGTDNYRVLYIEYQDGVKTRIAFNSNRANNSTIEEIRTLCLFSRKQYFDSLRTKS